MSRDILSTTETHSSASDAFTNQPTIPGMLVAHAKPGSVPVDRCQIQNSFVMGRGSECDFVVVDRKSSRRHFHIFKADDSFWIEDLGSRNGTFLGGRRITERQRLKGLDIIRAGEIVLVFLSNASSVLEPMPAQRFGLAGDFYSPQIIRDIHAALRSSRHVLIGGPSGSGKELAASAAASIIVEPDSILPFIAHNAARFSSEEEAVTTLFGVDARVFSNVAARPGLIERANSGVLFLDEIHNLPERVQRSLLRVIENGTYSRIGETRERKVDVRFILASNAPAPHYSLAHDLLARLRVLRIPSLKERIADIPSIFDHMLAAAFQNLFLDIEPATRALSADHYEAMCLDGFETDNVRGLADLADRIATDISIGTSATNAISKVFNDRYGGGPIGDRAAANSTDRSIDLTPREVPNGKRGRISHYEHHKDLIVDIFGRCGGNLAAAERMLKERGISCSRRWLENFLDKWGVPRRKNSKRS